MRSAAAAQRRRTGPPSRTMRPMLDAAASRPGLAALIPVLAAEIGAPRDGGRRHREPVAAVSAGPLSAGSRGDVRVDSGGGPFVVMVSTIARWPPESEEHRDALRPADLHRRADRGRRPRRSMAGRDGRLQRLHRAPPRARHHAGRRGAPPDRHRDDASASSTAGRRHGRAVRRDQGGARRVLPRRGRRPRRGDRARREDPGRHARLHRGATDLGATRTWESTRRPRRVAAN